MIWTILSFIIWIFYISVEAIREANFHHLKFRIPDIEFRTKRLILIQKALLLFLISIFLFYMTDNKIQVLSVINMILISPFIYNGAYFHVLNLLNSGTTFLKKWASNVEDKTPTLYLEFKLGKRLAILALILQFIICFIR